MYRGIWKLGGVILLLVSFKVSASGSSTGGNINQFKLVECGKTKCVTIVSPTAYVGAYQFKMYAFADAQVKIYDIKTKKQKIISSGDGYYDNMLNKIFLRTVGGDR